MSKKVTKQLNENPEAIDSLLDNLSDEELEAIADAAETGEDEGETLEEGEFRRSLKQHLETRGKGRPSKNWKDDAGAPEKKETRASLGKYYEAMKGKRGRHISYDEWKETLKEGEEVDGTGGTDGFSKTNAMSIAMQKLAGMDGDQIAFFLQSLDQVGHEADLVPNVSGKNQASIAMKGSPDSISAINALKECVKEDLATVFGDDKTLTEEFKNRLSTLFEAAVSGRVALFEAELAEAYGEALNEELSEITDFMVDQMDGYLNYVAEEWLAENAVGVDHSLRAENAIEFMDALKELLYEHNYSIPEGEEEIADAMIDRIEQLESELDEEIKKNMEMDAILREASKHELVRSATAGLTVAQSDRFRQLTESLEFNGDVDEFNHKLNVIRGANFGKATTKTSTGLITEEVVYGPNDKESKKPQAIDPAMRQHVAALARAIKQ